MSSKLKRDTRKQPSGKIPDFRAQMRKIFGKKKLKVSSAELLAWERDRY